MDNLDKELHRLSKISPSKAFIRESKARLLHQIQLQRNETWFRALIKKLSAAYPSEAFMVQARVRLMKQIKALPHQPLRGMAYLFRFLKRAVASTLAMTVAVFSVLIYTQGQRPVSASDDSYLIAEGDDVWVQHADSVSADPVNDQVELKKGDLILVGPESQALLHFFDGTQLRLNQDTKFLLASLSSSPTLQEQAVIEGTLFEGRIWGQMLNVDDDYSHLAITTDHFILNTFNSSFDVSVESNVSTEIAVFAGRLSLAGVNEAAEPSEKLKLTADQGIVTHDGAEDFLTNMVQIDESLLTDEWVQDNLEKDQENIAQLREKNLEMLSEYAGSLPGDADYFLESWNKDLTLTFYKDRQTAVEIAKGYLADAIILTENGELERAEESLQAYQELVNKILEANKNDEVEKIEPTELTHALVTPSLRVLNLEDPATSSTHLLEEVIQKTAEEIVQDDPVKLEEVKVRYAVAELEDIAQLVQSDQLEAAAEKLRSYKSSVSEVAQRLDDVAEDKTEDLAEIISLREDELALLNSVSETLVEADEIDDSLVEDLLMILDETSKEAEKNAEETIVAALPHMPELSEKIETLQGNHEISENDVVISEIGMTKIEEIVAQINAQETWLEMKNMMMNLLDFEKATPENIAFLKAVENSLSGRAANYLSMIIFKLERTVEPVEFVQNESVGSVLAQPPVVDGSKDYKLDDLDLGGENNGGMEVIEIPKTPKGTLPETDAIPTPTQTEADVEEDGSTLTPPEAIHEDTEATMIEREAENTLVPLDGRMEQIDPGELR